MRRFLIAGVAIGVVASAVAAVASVEPVAAASGDSRGDGPRLYAAGRREPGHIRKMSNFFGRGPRAS
jgi:hypothetical protein